MLSCSGQMVLGGTLQIAVLGGFVPPAGSAYVAIKYGTHTGTFSALDGANLGGGLQFAPTYTDTAIILSTGPLAITPVTSNHGGNSGVVSTVVHGVGFFPGLSARLSLARREPDSGADHRRRARSPPPSPSPSISRGGPRDLGPRRPGFEWVFGQRWATRSR